MKSFPRLISVALLALLTGASLTAQDAPASAAPVTPESTVAPAPTEIAPAPAAETSTAPTPPAGESATLIPLEAAPAPTVDTVTVTTEVAPAPKTVTMITEVAPATEAATGLTSLATPPADPVEAVAPTNAAPEPEQKPKDTLSVDFPDEEVRNILRNVADLFELNLVMPESLQGRTSIKLRDVTWRDIFRVTLSNTGYTMVEENNIVRIVSLAEADASPLSTVTIRLDNVSAIQLEQNLRPLLSLPVPEKPATSTSGGSPARPGGTLVVSAISNEILVTDRADRLERIVTLARALDVSPKQIVIEAKFVEITLDDTKVRSVGLANQSNRFGVLTGATTVPTPGQGFPLNPATLSGGFPNVVYNSEDFSAIAQFINSTGKARLVSNPTVVALNGQSSNIRVGRTLQLVRIEQENNGTNNGGKTTATADKEIFVGIELKVTAQITGRDLVELTVKPKKTSIGREREIAGNTFFDIDTREGDLKIMLQSGKIAAIGGFIDENNRKEASKVPFLGDIPFIGGAFRNTRDTKNTTNLVIFIAANVIDANKTDRSNTMSPELTKAIETRIDEKSALKEREPLFR